MPSTVNDLDRYAPAIVAGDTGAFGDFAAAAEPVVRDSLRSFAAKVDTEAVVQEAFLRLWQVAPRFQADGKDNGLLRLTLRIARNLAISETRRLRTQGKYRDELQRQVEASGPSTSPRPPDPLLRRLIEECRRKLPAKPGQALAERLASAGRLADSALAARVGMTKNTFLQNITRARKFLARCLMSQGVDVESMST